MLNSLLIFSENLLLFFVSLVVTIKFPGQAIGLIENYKDSVYGLGVLILIGSLINYVRNRNDRYSLVMSFIYLIISVVLLIVPSIKNESYLSYLDYAVGCLSVLGFYTNVKLTIKNKGDLM